MENERNYTDSQGKLKSEYNGSFDCPRCSEKVFFARTAEKLYLYDAGKGIDFKIHTCKGGT